MQLQLTSNPSIIILWATELQVQLKVRGRYHIIRKMRRNAFCCNIIENSNCQKKTGQLMVFLVQTFQIYTRFCYTVHLSTYKKETATNESDPSLDSCSIMESECAWAVSSSGYCFSIRAILCWWKGQQYSTLQLPVLYTYIQGYSKEIINVNVARRSWHCSTM